MKINIPFTVEWGLVDLSSDIDFTPEPFHSRESLLNTLRRKVLDHIMRSATVEIGESDLDKALEACNSIVADIELDVPPDDMTSTQIAITTLEEYENERLNYGDDDENDNWLHKHNSLCHIDQDRNDSYDTDALIKTVLAYEYYQ